MDQQQMLDRTRSFAIRVMRLTDSLPRCQSADVVGKQLLRCATSVGANYRAARRARSKAEFLSKLGIVEEESDESLYWLGLLADSGLVKPARLTELINEADEITAIIVATIRTGKRSR